MWYRPCGICMLYFFFFQAEDGIRDIGVTGVQTCALPISNKDAKFLEPVNENSKPYINIIVSRKADKDNETYKKIIKAYQADDVKKVIEETSKGSSLPAWENK